MLRTLAIAAAAAMSFVATPAAAAAPGTYDFSGIRTYSAWARAANDLATRGNALLDADNVVEWCYVQGDRRALANATSDALANSSSEIRQYRDWIDENIRGRDWCEKFDLSMSRPETRRYYQDQVRRDEDQRRRQLQQYFTNNPVIQVYQYANIACAAMNSGPSLHEAAQAGYRVVSQHRQTSLNILGGHCSAQVFTMQR